MSLVAARQDQVTQTAHQILLAIAKAPGLLEGAPGECQRYLKALTEDIPLFANLGLIGLDGNFRCHGLGGLARPVMGVRFFELCLLRQGSPCRTAFELFEQCHRFLEGAAGRFVTRFAVDLVGTPASGGILGVAGAARQQGRAHQGDRSDARGR